MLLVALSCIVFGALALYLYFRARFRRMMTLSEKIPGRSLQPIVGNALQFGFNTEAFLGHVNDIIKEYGSISRSWLGNELVIWISDPKAVETLLTNTNILDKSFMYKYLHPWLGEGLLTSTGLKWKQHRKLFTPAFHFKILEEFVEVFDRNEKIMIQKLEKHANGVAFDIYPYIALCTLDIICETAMGVRVDAQHNGKSEYVQAVRGMGNILMSRTFKPWYRPELLYRLSSLAKDEVEFLGTLHDKTNSVIKMRKDEHKQNGLKKHKEEESNNIGSKIRLPFLDLLIQAQQDGHDIGDKEIREEVDTFMFEGNDTTTAGICFTLLALAENQDVQAKAVQELQEILGERNRDLTMKDLHEMKYIELVIKEAQRLYPTVPVFGRSLFQNLKVGNYMLPAGSNVMINTYMLHRNADQFPDPERFDPNRFLPENCKNRHPFAYVPFSAGPRNCIGQKFAMLEMKAAISAVLKHYKLSSVRPNSNLQYTAELVLKVPDGIVLKLEHRDWSAPGQAYMT